MKNKGLFVLIGLVVLSVGYAVFDFQNEKRQEAAKSEAAYLLPFKKEEISEIQIQRFGANGISEKIQLKKQAEGWSILEPISELADQNSVSEFMDSALGEKSVDVVKEDPNINWKIYGLDSPLGKITFKSDKGQEFSVDISTVKNYIQDIYLRIKGENRVLLAHSSWGNWVDKKPFDFRDKRVFRDLFLNINSVKLSKGKTTLEIKKTKGQWIAPQYSSWKLDQTRAGEIASMLSATQLVEFIKEGEVSKDDLKKYSLDHPALTIEASLNDGKKWLANLSVDKAKAYYIQTFDPARIGKLAQIDGDKFMKKDIEEIRDRKEPFNFKKDQVKKIEILLGEQKPQFELRDDNWKLVSEIKDFEINPDQVKNVLAQMQRLEVSDFSENDASGSFADVIRFKDLDGKNLLELAKGKSLKKKIDGKEKQLLIVKTNLYKSPIAIEENAFKNLGLDSILKKKAEIKLGTEVKSK